MPQKDPMRLEFGPDGFPYTEAALRSIWKKRKKGKMIKCHKYLLKVHPRPAWSSPWCCQPPARGAGSVCEAAGSLRPWEGSDGGLGPALRLIPAASPRFSAALERDSRGGS